VVIALSVRLVVTYGPGHAPSLLVFGAFCGAFSLGNALYGVGACFVEKLQGIHLIIVDAVTALLITAASIVSTNPSSPYVSACAN